MIKSKMTLKMANNNVAILQRNGEDMVCPFVPPLQIRQKVQNAFGQIGEQLSIQKSPCNSNCPLFDIGIDKVFICCSGTKIEHTIQETFEYKLPEENNDNNIINLGGGSSN